ncbi:excalibur calcium-binding domain-containing protein [Nonomuraea sp. NPDC005501]|uniref:excalibur calcium-binding domain-containing protein n=1 Tax=Nonomuraea sp. NPDC005501 TaxID=3156884 RepID=UPI00339E3AE0
MLIVSLVLVVVIAGVLGTVAVLMTRSPDAPLLGGVPPQRLPTPIHFAPIREQKPAPCPGAEAALDERQTTCYLLEDGVTVEAVQRIEPVREKDGTYSVRVAIAPKYKEKVVALIDEMVPDQRQIAVVLVPRTVVAAPVVTQSMDGDSLSIAGFTKEEAEALATRLLGSPPATGQPGTGQPGTGQPGTDQPGTDQPGTGQQPGTGEQPGTGQQTGTGQPLPGATNPATQGTSGTGLTDTTGAQTTGTQTMGTQTTGTQTTGTQTTGTQTTGTQTTGTQTAGTQTGRRAPDRRYTSCKEAVAAGRGPYTKGTHEEYSWYVDVDGNGVACNPGDIR